MGYKRGQKSFGRGTRLKMRYSKFINISIITSIIYLIIKLIVLEGGEIQNIFLTFHDASKSYANRATNYRNIFLYIDIFFNPVTIIAITNGIYCGKQLSRKYRYCVYLLIASFILSSIGSATRAGIVIMFILITAALLLGIYKRNIVFKFYHKVFITFLTFIFIVGFLSYFALLNQKRSKYTPLNPITKELPDKDFVLYKTVPDRFHPLINGVSFYISHAYYRLNQAFDLPFNGIGLGLSNSYFIMDNVEEMTGWHGLKEISYGLRLDMKQNGFYGNYWSTFYTWIASDFTFPGTIIVIYFIGYFFSLSLRDVLYGPNPFSVTVFCLLFGFIFHFAFNNPLQDGSGITTNVGITILWLVYRKK